MKLLLTFAILALTVTAYAQGSVYQLTFEDTDNTVFLAERNIAIYAASKRVKDILAENLGKDVVASDHISGIIVRTEDADLAVQEIMNQLAQKTGEKIGHVWNSNLKKASPTAIMMGASPSTTWYIVLSPREEGDYVLTISYLIEGKKKPEEPIGPVPYSETD